MNKNQKEIIETSAKNFIEGLNQGANWIWHSYKLIDNGFEVYSDGTLCQKFIFDFDKNVYTIFDKERKSWTKWKTFYINPLILPCIEYNKNYPELNKKQNKDKKFFVELVVDGYIDHETQEWMDRRMQDPDFDPWDDEFDFCDYQKHEIFIVWAPNKETIQKWNQQQMETGKIKSRKFLFQDQEGNEGWIGSIFSQEELVNKKEG